MYVCMYIGPYSSWCVGAMLIPSLWPLSPVGRNTTDVRAAWPVRCHTYGYLARLPNYTAC